MISHGKARGTSGFFWLNAAEMQINVLGDGWNAGESKILLPSDQKRIDTLWMSEAGVVDAFFFVGPGPKDVVKQYVAVTGLPAILQPFATGYHQCRWNYTEEEDIEQVDLKFDEYDIPYDVLWLDIEHTVGKKYFKWEKVLFPHPEKMQKKLASKDRHMVTIVDPHIMRDDSYFIDKEATDRRHYVRDATGKDFDGWEIHNAYGYYFHMGTAGGLVKRGDGKDRPFVLSRAFLAGTQKCGAVWTGDNTAEREHLWVSVPMVLTMGLSAATFAGADVGGLFSNPEPELLVRWYELRSYHPFFGGHAHHDTKRRLFGERNTELMRDAIHACSVFLPYFYTLFSEANTTGIPAMRPLWMEFRDDEAAYSNDEAFMVGNSLLMQGIYSERAKHICIFAWKGILVIALNSSQAAEGELYVDDGKSFEFGTIHRFIFSNGKLTSLNWQLAEKFSARLLSKERLTVLRYFESS
ncbi:hypothetical protein Ancab_024364 [Ancistrocladus abbreviatus]